MPSIILYCKSHFWFVSFYGTTVFNGKFAGNFLKFEGLIKIDKSVTLIFLNSKLFKNV